MNMEDKIMQINIDDIIPNRFQPRIVFDNIAMKELVESIKEHGVIQPIVVRKVKDLYEIIAGERRYKASCEAGLKTIPCIIASIDDNDSAEIALIENIQRKDLSSIEEAFAYKNILDKKYLTQDALARKLGKSQSSLSNKLRLLKLPKEVQDALLNEIISEKHARMLLTLNDDDLLLSMFDKTVKENLTSRQLEILINDEKNPKFIESKYNTFDNINNKNNTWVNEISTPKFINNNIPNFSEFKEDNDFNKSKVSDKDAKSTNNSSKKQNDIKVAINTINQAVDTLKKHGYKVKVDDFDFEDIHQLVINIQK